MKSVVPLLLESRDDHSEDDGGVLVPLPPRLQPWNTSACCALINRGEVRELHAAARWVFELYPPALARGYPEFEITVYHAGWAEALTLQAFGPPKTAEQRIGREYAAKMLHQVLSASYQARP